MFNWSEGYYEDIVPKEYLSHIADDGRTQTVTEHLIGTAKLAEVFAEEFHAGEYGALAGLMHDLGKATEAFQRRLHGGNKVDHASAGAVECARVRQTEVSISIIGHHSGLPDEGNPYTDQAGDPTYCGRIKKNLTPTKGNEVHWNRRMPEIKTDKASARDKFDESVWTRMLFSCLVDADYLDTEKFMKGREIRTEDYDGIPVLEQRLTDYISEWGEPSSPINQYRSEIRTGCEEKADMERGLFSLTVPTGGGKTLTSLSFALKHAVHHQMQRIIYVIPYTSIVEQTAKVFSDILGERNVLEHHSGSDIGTSESPDEKEYRKMLATENWDAPIIVTTSVQFFESLFANKSSRCRKLHNIANSVVIFDEAQMIPSEHLLPCVYMIASIIRRCNVSAVLCTATQPFLEDLFHKKALSATELCPDPEKYYLLFRRVSFENIGQVSTDGLADRLRTHRQVLCIVNSRAAAQELFLRLPEEGRYHLSTWMYPMHRREKLDEIRKRLREGMVCRVISTSLIEAGVDVDFPAVYREKAGLDSVLQAAGRCNREGKQDKKDSVVRIFEGVSKTPLLLRVNIAAADEALAGAADPSDPQTVEYYFRAYRSLIGDSIDKTGTVKMFEEGIAGCRLPFKTAAEHFRLIENDTKTIYLDREGDHSEIEQIRNGFATKSAYRIAGRYCVQVYSRQYEQLVETGAVESIDPESGILRDEAMYSAETGLLLTQDQKAGGDSFFV